MGTSYQASVILGYEVEIKPWEGPVTRYNEKTGEPYKGKEKVGWRCLIGGIPILLEERDAPWWIDDEKIHGLNLYDYGWEHQDFFLGVECAVVDGHGLEGYKNVIDRSIPAPLQKFKDKFGLDFSPYLIMSCG